MRKHHHAFAAAMLACCVAVTPALAADKMLGGTQMLTASGENADYTAFPSTSFVFDNMNACIEGGKKLVQDDPDTAVRCVSSDGKITDITRPDADKDNLECAKNAAQDDSTDESQRPDQIHVRELRTTCPVVK